MATNKHIIDIQTKGAKKSEKQVNGVTRALGGLAKQAGIAAAAYFGSRMLLDGLKQSIDLFAKQELAEKKLRFAAGSSTNELIRQAQALQQTTRLGDEALIAQQAYVKSLGISTEQTKEIIAASVDLAAAMGISLESAVMNTTKTLSGMQGELGEKLPAAFKELTAEQLKAGEGIVFIREQFRGTAEEETKTLTGSLDQMRNAVGDAAETLGETFAPLIISVAGAVKSLAEGFQSLLNWQEQFDAQVNAQVKILTDAEIAAMAYNEAVGQMAQQQVLEEILKITEGLDGMSASELDATITSQEFKDSLDMAVESGAIHADQLSLLYNRYIKLSEATKKQTKEETKRQKALRILGDLSKNEGLAEARISQLTAVINTSEAVTKFLAKGRFGQAALAGIMGAKEIATIESTISRFATGADYITSGPEMIMVGDNPSGQERVQVTPLGGDPNINGPQGGGMTINIQGSVIGTEDFTEQVLMPQIEEGLRLGNRI